MPIFTHERVLTTSGLLAKTGILWGGNALQSITIGRHTPKDPQQAIGYLGIVDYTTGVITSDVTLDAILTEQSSKATEDSSVYVYARKPLEVGTESYVLTSIQLGFAAGQAATVSYGYLTNTLASYLDIRSDAEVAALTMSHAEEANFAVVMGDDGSGIALKPTWVTGTVPLVNANGIPIINSSGVYAKTSDDGLPAGVQSINFNATINRDQVLDVRSASPIQFVTTYPIDIRVDAEVFDLPVPSGTKKQGDEAFDSSTFANTLRKLKDLSVEALALNKHAGALTNANSGDVYAKAFGLMATDESEAMAMGRYLQFTMNFVAADLQCPLPDGTT